MKYIVRILVSAFAFISAAACYNNEIENPDNPQNPGQSGLRITATMVKTRVNYGNETDKQLLPVWEPDDILFGFYVDGSKVIQNFILEVVDTSNSTATLGFVKGNENGLADQPLETKVYLIYTGKNGDSSIADTDIFSSDGEFSVDLTSQNLDRIPVCMSASAEIEDGSDGEKTLSFGFAYDCAVLEVETLAGFEEDGFDAGSLSGIEVSGISFKGKYSYDNGNITFAAVEDINNNNSYSTSLIDWSVSADSELTCRGETKKILISAIPTSNHDITISYKRNNSDFCSETFSNSTLEKGNCYVIRHNYVAKTSDGHFFTTVSAAFEHAAELFDSDNLDAEHNIVTLVRDCGFAGIDDKGAPKAGDEDCIYIDGYDVTLDLNGHTLSLIDGDYDTFYVNGKYDYGVGDDVATGTYPRNTFAIKDSKGNGKLLNNAYYHAVVNFGSFVLTSGIMDNYNERTAVMNSGSFTMYGGKLLKSNAVYNTYALQNINGNANIYGGYIYSNADVAIECDADSKLIIGDDSGKDILISSSGTGAIALNNSEGLIYSGTITCSTNNTIVLYNDSKCTISGGNIICTGEYSAIKCTNNNGQDSHSELYITWPSDTRSIGISRKEPFLYSHSVKQHYAPVFVASGVDGKNNSATIHILGGFIYNEDTTDLSAYLDRGCFSVNRGNEHALNSDNDFYSNVTRFYEFNDTPKGDKEKYDESYTTDYYSIPKSRVEDGAEGNLIFTYHIMGAIDPTLSPDTEAGKTQSYQFGGFSW